MAPIDLQPLFHFLAQLRAHNQREWFEKHRADYEDAKTRFEDLVSQIIIGLAPVDGCLD